VPLCRAGEAEPHAYACGSCGFVRTSYTAFRRWGPEDVDNSRREALRCCACWGCGGHLPRFDRGLLSSLCPACAAAEREADRARRAAEGVRRAADADSFSAAEEAHLRSYRFALSDGRTGRAYLCDDYGGVFCQGFARLDPVGGDEPAVYRATLKRSESDAVLEPVADLCRDADALLASWAEAGPAAGG